MLRDMNGRIRGTVVIAVALVILAEFWAGATTRLISFTATQYTTDLWFVMDAIWRVAQAQTPSVDFVSSIGPAYYGIYAALLRAEPFSMAVMFHANALVGLAAALATAAVLGRRAQPETVLLVALVALLAAVSGREFGAHLPALSVSFLAPYNRWGWAAIVPVAFGLLLPWRRPHWPAALVIGTLAAFLLFLKASYFAVALGLLAASVLLDIGEPDFRRKLFARLGGFAAPLVVATLLAGLVPGLLPGYFGDLRQAAAITAAARTGKAMRMTIEATGTLSLALLVLYLAGGLRHWRDRADVRNIARVVLMVGAGGAALLQNHDAVEAPLYIAALLLAYELGTGQGSQRTDAVRPEWLVPGGQWAVLGIALIAVAQPLAAEAATPLTERAKQLLGRQVLFADFGGTPLDRFSYSFFADRFGHASPDRLVIAHRDVAQFFCTERACADLRAVMDGLTGLRTLGTNGVTVLPLSFSNPYSALTHTPSPRHDLMWWDPDRSYNARTAPPAAVLLRDVGIVMQPRADPYGQAMWDLYGSAIRHDFHPRLQTAAWTFWVRDDGPIPPGRIAARPAS